MFIFIWHMIFARTEEENFCHFSASNFYLNHTKAPILQNARRGVYFRTPGAYGPLGGESCILGWSANPGKQSVNGPPPPGVKEA